MILLDYLCIAEVEGHIKPVKLPRIKQIRARKGKYLSRKGKK